MIPGYLRPKFDAIPNPDAVVRSNNIRITALTSRLIRFEYSPTNTFEDRPSQAFWFRNQPAPQLNVAGNGLRLDVATSHLNLSYILGGPPSPDRFTIHIYASDHLWHYGDADNDNLKGTYRTLDTIDGVVNLEPGLLSRSGWAAVDDSRSLVFNEQGWLENRGAPEGTVDMYFFAYGQAYQDCLRDYRLITGSVPLLPRWALGNWWSRYFNYSADDIRRLVKEFQTNRVPLSVFIIDMDWHITKTGNTSSGWTGYTWNKDLFPDPKNLIDDLHQAGLKTALNLHPADGIHNHEAAYKDFAKGMGMNPKDGDPIPFDLADPNFASLYFDLLHHPREAEGVDFWWIDWQQGTLSGLPGLDPLWWLNHLHFYDLARPRPADSKGKKAAKPSPDADTEPSEVTKTRSFIFSRWGGLGNHRYPIGFSGDTVISWDSLAFQPYFTATAANVSYGWWSHDIGGHMGGVEDPELYTRWVQYGVFSPIFRLHSTNNPYHERRPFGYDRHILGLARSAMQLRHTLIPYLYTMSWRDHHEHTAPIRPLYHLQPDEEAAYHYPNVYTFGSELIAAPFISPLNPETNLARQPIWLPKGDWFNFFTGEHLSGGHHTIYGGLGDIPVFAKAGAIVPLAAPAAWGGVENPTHLRVQVFPGADNHYDHYEDDGHTAAYLAGHYAITPFSQKWEGDKLVFTIGPVRGDANRCPAKRTYQIQFWTIEEPDQVVLRINGVKRTVIPEYQHETHSLVIPIQIEIQPADTVIITIKKDGSKLMHPRNRILPTCRRLLDHFRLESWTKGDIGQHLAEIVQNPALLAHYRPTLSEAHLQVLLETITGAGCYRTSHAGEDVIVLWNPANDPMVAYQLTVNQLKHGPLPGRFYHESGTAPGFKIFHTAEFRSNPWRLQFRYNNILDIVLP